MYSSQFQFLPEEVGLGHVQIDGCMKFAKNDTGATCLDTSYCQIAQYTIEKVGNSTWTTTSIRELTRFTLKII